VGEKCWQGWVCGERGGDYVIFAGSEKSLSEDDGKTLRNPELMYRKAEDQYLTTNLKSYTSCI
jgi:hypothetical protein